MRLVFMGSPDFAVPALKALIDAGHEIIAVYSQPPRPAGRGKALHYQPVHLAAESYNIDVRTPLKLKGNKEEIEFLKDSKLDAIIVAAYGLILPKDILSLPQKGCLNIHASLLPRWRGASPIQSSIRAGDKKTGICIMQMDEGLDTGDILLKAETDITTADTASTLHDRLSALGAELIVKSLIEQPHPIAQAENGATYAPRLYREDGRIDWSCTAQEIDCQIRAFTPWPGNFTTLNGQTIRIGSVEIIEPNQKIAPPGTILDDALTIACGQGLLRLTTLQKPGRAMMDADAFLRGFMVAKGACFE
ncbi:methionyl-tRNA formyltransferase [Aristophania vespae]|uniref:Methionyl-tRNA formyltransferase n=1 Tax=Aristophania vespae TaxID=2697033 RepID=A0A6P1NI73_9PROT|nr:methionyl-tRNA formyltransferase [Aristophania vespae]QHI95352.1 methionyl-tRNA formyltransferase [Aristophania vespae]